VGNMVKSVVNGTTTYYPSTSYQEEVTGGTTTIYKYYSLGSQRVAMRTNSTLAWLMTDQINSTTVTASATGSLNSEIRYTAFGTIRYENGITPTDYRYTGQLQQAVIGLDYYNARWYDPQLGRFIQADTIISNAKNPASYDRYAYVNNNPINHNDPTGHFVPLIVIAAWVVANSEWLFPAIIMAAVTAYGAVTSAMAGDTRGVVTSVAMAPVIAAGIPEINPELGAETVDEGAAEAASDVSGTSGTVDSNPLYRTMKPDEDGLPIVGPSKTMLGATTSGAKPDIMPDNNGMVGPGNEGMSVSTDPYDMEDYRRPPEFDGKAKGQQMYSIDEGDLGPDLSFEQVGTNAHPSHGVIVPAYPMPVEQYQAAIAATRSFWRPVTPIEAR